ncbi:hypothetical protein V8E55_009235 [Tylopilus felleus]
MTDRLVVSPMLDPEAPLLDCTIILTEDIVHSTRGVIPSAILCLSFHNIIGSSEVYDLQKVLDTGAAVPFWTPLRPIQRMLQPTPFFQRQRESVKWSTVMIDLASSLLIRVCILLDVSAASESFVPYRPAQSNLASLQSPMQTSVQPCVKQTLTPIRRATRRAIEYESIKERLATVWRNPMERSITFPTKVVPLVACLLSEDTGWLVTVHEML